MLDVTIIVGYFVIIFLIGFFSRSKTTDTSADEFFLSSRSLKWPTIAISTISTNIHAGHFLGMMGSAYLFGLAQANLEINAIFGILVAAFIFVPLYLKKNVVTITQFFEEKLGPRIALAYSALSLLLFSCLYLGSALFWGAYAIDSVFNEKLLFISADPVIRTTTIVIVLAFFSASYTLLGGLTAVVRTDIVQFLLLVGGGVVLLFFAIDKLGGWSELYIKTPQLMHLHLSADHPQLPWTAIFSMLLLNLNYWGCNQVILQRALAAKSLRHAQVGLLVGGLLKYVMAAIIIIPGIALAGILGSHALKDPDQSFLTLINMLLPPGLRGLILVGLFASLMSSVDSMFHSLATLWSIDIYKRYINTKASDAQMIKMGKWAIVVCVFTGIFFGFIQIYIKYQNPNLALSHWFNDMSYYIKNGFVILIISAVFLINPSRKLVLIGLLGSIALSLGLKAIFPEMPYFNRSLFTILITLAFVSIPAIINNDCKLVWRGLVHTSEKRVGQYGLALGASLVFLQIIFH